MQHVHNIINLTPHEINVLAEGMTLAYPPSGDVARVTQRNDQIDHPATQLGVPVKRAVFGRVIGLPDMREDTTLIVSAMVKAAAPERTDLVSPGEPVRDSSGNVIGCGCFLA